MSTANECEQVLKIVIVGDSGVGKTNLLNGQTRRDWNSHDMMVSGAEFLIKRVQVENKLIKAQIWDTSGKENYRTITNALYRGAVGALLVYDVANHMSFEHCASWLGELHAHADGNLVVMLVGNKADLEHRRKVSTEEARLFAERNKLLFLETSTQDITSIDTALCCILTEVLRRQRLSQSPSPSPTQPHAPMLQHISKQASCPVPMYQQSDEPEYDQTAVLQATISRLENELKEARQQEAACREKLEAESQRRQQLEESLNNLKNESNLSSPAVIGGNGNGNGKEQMIITRGDYTVLKNLGGGIFDRVCLSVRKSDGAKFAIKEVDWTAIADALAIKSHRLTCEELMKMATDEAELMVNIQHPNIIRVFGYFQDQIGGHLCYHLIMEKFESGTLHDVIVNRQGELFSQAQVLPWIEQLCSALKYLHDSNIVHNDVKTTNIFMLDGHKMVKLGDFGRLKEAKHIAKILPSTESYTAPEQFNGESYSDKCDVWGLGVAIYETVCLRLPFDSKDRAEIKGKILTEKPLPIPDQFGNSMQQLVDGLLEKDPSKRLTMARALRVALLISVMDAIE